MRHKPIPTDKRLLVYEKFGGHCAYCGCEMTFKRMQVDHKESIYRTGEQIDDMDNLMPSCRSCNYYKGTKTIDEFRESIQNTLMQNVRKPFDYRLAMRYGLVREDIKPIVFYFEMQ